MGLKTVCRLHYGAQVTAQSSSWGRAFFLGLVLQAMTCTASLSKIALANIGPGVVAPSSILFKGLMTRENMYWIPAI